MEAGKSYALVVFGGDKESEGLAADFAKLGTKFNSDVYSLTCLSGINLREVMKVIGGPITFGRDDLTGEELVYSKNEPSFYEVVTMNFKERVLDWVKTKASLMTGDDCMIVILIAHGSRRGLIGLETAQGYEYLTVNEMSEALNTPPRDTRLLLVNEACYSGSWIAATSGLTNAVLFEAA